MRRVPSRAATEPAWETLAPEFRVLCLAVRRPQSAADGAALRATIGEGVDWQRVVRGARRHRVVAMVLSGLRAHGGLPVPAEIMDQLRMVTAGNARRALAQAVEVARLAGLLSENGVRVLVLKGVAMSLQLHGDLALRGVGDIDLLVAPADFPAADAVLVAAGYRRQSSTGDPVRGVVDWGLYRDLSYHAPHLSEVVELHQRLTASQRRLPYDFEALWRDRLEVPLAGAAVSVLSLRTLPLYLCVHGAYHCWERLCWLSDLSALLRQPDFRSAMIADAEAHGLGRAMRLAVALDDRFLGAGWRDREPRMTNPKNDARADRYLLRFFVGNRWLQQPSRGSWEWLRYETWRRWELYTLKDGWRHVLDEARAELLNPVDRTVIPLPRRLRWLYPLLRPVGWVVRNLRRRGTGQRRT